MARRIHPLDLLQHYCKQAAAYRAGACIEIRDSTLSYAGDRGWEKGEVGVGGNHTGRMRE